MQIPKPSLRKSVPHITMPVTCFRLAKHSCIVLALLLACLQHGLAQSSTGKVVGAANKFLATLSAEQKQKVMYAYDDKDQRSRWSNLPTGFVPRGGINLKEMSSPQRDAAMALM